MNKYTIYCTEEQTKKALELGAPIEILPNYTEYRVFPLIKFKDGNERPCVLPTAEQMIGWLEEQGIVVDITTENSGCEWSIWVKKEHCANYSFIEENNEYCLSRKEATIAAIDAALDYLE